MNWWSELTVGDVVRALGRYRPVYLAVAGILVLALVLPGVESSGGPSSVAAGPAGGVARTDTRSSGAAEDSDGGPGQATVRTAGGDGTDVGAAGGRPTAAAGDGLATPLPPAITDANIDPLAAPDCDTATGRIQVPSKFAPPCVPIWPGGDNGGATYQGVTDDEIVVAVRWGETNPATTALLVGAGAEDTEDDQRATRQGWADLFEAHHETYGRQVKLVYFEESGDDEEAERADAIKVATEIKAFAAWGGPDAYADELAARGVLCLCGGNDAAFFIERAPYVWGTQPSWEQWLGPAAEYIGKRLWGRPAVHAGDPAYNVLERKIGIVYAEPAEGEAVNKAGVEYMERELGNYGAGLHDKVSYQSDINRAQEQATTIIARLKDKGITTVVFWGDPVAPIFFTKEATNQRYRPEWVIVGGNLVDTTFFGRTYDQTQWSQAFGVSQLWARGPQTQNEVFHLYGWHNGEDPAAQATYEIIYQTPWMFYTALHLAGPNLNPETFRAGLFAFPVSGGGPTLVTRSFGNQGLWPFEDYTSFDDVTEVWWDASAVGENEIGQNGRGMWAYVDGGKRYRFGEWPTTDPKVFNPEGAVTKYDEVPPEDKFPEYEHPPEHHRGGGE